MASFDREQNWTVVESYLREQNLATTSADTSAATAVTSAATATDTADTSATTANTPADTADTPATPATTAVTPVTPATTADTPGIIGVFLVGNEGQRRTFRGVTYVEMSSSSVLHAKAAVLGGNYKHCVNPTDWNAFTAALDDPNTVFLICFMDENMNRKHQENLCKFLSGINICIVVQYPTEFMDAHPDLCEVVQQAPPTRPNLSLLIMPTREQVQAHEEKKNKNKHLVMSAITDEVSVGSDNKCEIDDWKKKNPNGKVITFEKYPHKDESLIKLVPCTDKSKIGLVQDETNPNHMICYFDPENPEIPEIPNVRIYLIDEHDNLDTDIKKYFNVTKTIIDQCVSRMQNVLVHCHMGISRSPTIVIHYIMCSMNMSYEEAYAFVKKRRQCVDPNVAFVQALNSVNKKL